MWFRTFSVVVEQIPILELSFAIYSCNRKSWQSFVGIVGISAGNKGHIHFKGRNWKHWSDFESLEKNFCLIWWCNQFDINTGMWYFSFSVSICFHKQTIWLLVRNGILASDLWLFSYRRNSIEEWERSGHCLCYMHNTSPVWFTIAYSILCFFFSHPLDIHCSQTMKLCITFNRMPLSKRNEFGVFSTFFLWVSMTKQRSQYGQKKEKTKNSKMKRSDWFPSR